MFGCFGELPFAVGPFAGALQDAPVVPPTPPRFDDPPFPTGGSTGKTRYGDGRKKQRIVRKRKPSRVVEEDQDALIIEQKSIINFIERADEEEIEILLLSQ